MDDAIQKFVESIVPVMLEAGQYAMESQGQVQNVGKDEDDLIHSDNEYVQKRGRAKTVIDEQVQEKLLVRAYQIFGGDMIHLDAEEDTPSKKLFVSQSADITLVIDPIDGTLEYLNGTDGYSVCVALVSKGNVQVAIVYFPVKKILYLLDSDHKAYICTVENLNITEKTLIQPPTEVKNEVVYVNNRVPVDANDCLSGKFTVIKDIDGKVTWPEALLSCITGEYKTALFVKPQIRDVLLGAMIESMPGGYASDFEGNKIIWPHGGRIPQIAFGFGTLTEDVKSCLI